MSKLILAATLAAIATTMSSVSAAATANAATAQVAQRDHIRTTMHGAKGPVVVLIPGMSTPAKVWDAMAARMSGEHRVLVVEVKGFDGTRAPANEGDGMIDGIVGDLAADLVVRKIDKAVVAGHSFGGLVAMKFALAHPEAAKSVVVVDALPFFGTVFAADATVETLAPRAKAMRDMMVAQADAIRAIGAKGITKDPGGTMSIDPARRIQISTWSMKADPLVVGQALLEDMAMDLRKDIAAIRVPMAVLYQAHEDPALAAKRYETDYAAKADTRLIPVKNTGHFIQLDQPETVRTAIEAAAR